MWIEVTEHIPDHPEDYSPARHKVLINTDAVSRIETLYGGSLICDNGGVAIEIEESYGTIRDMIASTDGVHTAP